MIRQRKIVHKIQCPSALVSTLDDAITYLDSVHPTSGETSIDLLRELAKDRYARYIAKATSSDDFTTGLEMVTNEKTGAEIDAGVYETIQLGCFGAIVRATATLFNQEGCQWTWGENENVEEIMGLQRDSGAAYLQMQRWDSLSVALGSSVLLLGWSVIGQHLTYQVIAPQLVYFGYGETIDIDGEITRPDWGRIEDASVVILQLAEASGTDSSKAQYMAYFGQCDAYPRGRCVVYRARDPYEIPEPGATNADIIAEYTEGEESANPLVLAECEYEYPVAICYGKVASSTLMPVDPTPYLTCREFDLAASRILTAAADGARGTVVFSVAESGSGGLLPRTVRGVVALPRGVEYQETGHEGAGAAQTAWELLLSQIECYGETAANIGGFELTPDTSRAPESGFALSIRAQPKKIFRDQRIAQMRPQVSRLWEIEKALLNYLSDTTVSEETAQTWEPGEISMPADPTAAHELNKLQLDDGVISYVEYVRRELGFATAEEAREAIETMTKDNAEYPPPKAPAPPQNPSLAGDLKARLMAKRQANVGV